MKCCRLRKTIARHKACFTPINEKQQIQPKGCCYSVAPLLSPKGVLPPCLPGHAGFHLRDKVQCPTAPSALCTSCRCRLVCQLWLQHAPPNDPGVCCTKNFVLHYLYNENIFLCGRTPYSGGLADQARTIASLSFLHPYLDPTAGIIWGQQHTELVRVVAQITNIILHGKFLSTSNVHPQSG